MPALQTENNHTLVYSIHMKNITLLLLAVATLSLTLSACQSKPAPAPAPAPVSTGAYTSGK